MKGETDRMAELYKTIDAQIALKEKQAHYGNDRRQRADALLPGMEDRRKGDRRSKARAKESPDK
jgi:hypothetical protein